MAQKSTSQNDRNHIEHLSDVKCEYGMHKDDNSNQPSDHMNAAVVLRFVSLQEHLVVVVFTRLRVHYGIVHSFPIIMQRAMIRSY